MGTSTTASKLEFDDATAMNEAYQDRGWTDGLPVVAPSAERVGEFLQAAELEAGDVVAVEQVRSRELTAEKLAANAVMAGCTAQAFPVVVAAIQGMCDERYLLHGSSASTGGSAPLLVVNGPVRGELGMNSGYNALANHSRANATIGRAIRLVLINLLEYRPGEFDRSTLGHPGKFTFCLAEDEEDSPWRPLALERREVEGRPLPSGASAVTVMAASSPHLIMNEWTKDPEEILETFAAAIRANMLVYSIWSGNYAVVFPKQLRDNLAEAGWSKRDVRELIHQRARVPRGAWESVGKAAVVDDSNRDREYPALDEPDDLLVVAAGGPANGFGAVIPPWFGHKSRAVTTEIRPPHTPRAD